MLPQPHWFVLLNVVFLTALPNISNYTKQAFFFFCSSPFRGFQAFHKMRGMNQSTTNQSTYCPLRNLHQNLNQDCMLFTTYFNGIHNIHSHINSHININVRTDTWLCFTIDLCIAYLRKYVWALYINICGWWVYSYIHTFVYFIIHKYFGVIKT